MTGTARSPYSYRDDPQVPPFDDSRPLFIFDGICVLCSGGVAWIMRYDRDAKIAFTDAQGPLGEAIYRHYGLDFDDTYLFLVDGQAYTLMEGYFEVARVLGGAWRLAAVFRVVPRRLRDAFYRLVARNRYRWFGTAGHCELLTPEQRSRLIQSLPRVDA